MAVGVGITTTVLVGAIATELAPSAIEFSLFVGIPLGILAGVGSLRTLGTDDHRQLAAIGGVAAVGYTILCLVAVRYAVSVTREPLSMPVALGIGLVVGVVAFGWLWSVERRSTHSGGS